MPKGPNGQKRPGDVIGAAIMVARIATGEVEDNATPADTGPHIAPPPRQQVFEDYTFGGITTGQN